MRKKMTKAEVLAEFREYILPEIKRRYESDGKPDYIARREEWNNYTDSLCKDGRITPKQYESWSNPF